MELRVLKYFLIAAREENITKAATLLHLTQPTLSRQLRQCQSRKHRSRLLCSRELLHQNAMNAITTGRIRQTVPIVQIGRIMSRAMAMPIAIIPIMQGTVVRQMQIMRSRIGIQQLQVLLAILLVMPAMLEIVITQASIASSHLPTEKIIMHRGIA